MAVALLAGGLVFVPLASAQTAPAQPSERPGLLHAIGRWFEESAATFRSHLRGAKKRMDDLGDEAAASRRQFDATAAEVGKNAADATRSAVDAVAKIPASRVMSGRERCAVAPNGAPDCLAAAQTLCRKHGFASGSSIDFTSAEECPPRAVLASQPSRAECTTVTFISRAMCQ